MTTRGRADSQSDLSSAPAGVPRRKWSLTQQAFDALLAALGEDRELAGEKYLEIRANLTRFFEWRGAPFPEDHADETINRVAKRLGEGEEIRNSSGYFLGVARMLMLEIGKQRTKDRETAVEMAIVHYQTTEMEEIEPRVECLKECLAGLSGENRDLILQYYEGEKGEKIENRQKLSERLNTPLNALRMRALRLRERLQACVNDCVEKR